MGFGVGLFIVVASSFFFPNNAENKLILGHSFLSLDAIIPHSTAKWNSFYRCVCKNGSSTRLLPVLLFCCECGLSLIHISSNADSNLPGRGGSGEKLLQVQTSNGRIDIDFTEPGLDG